MNRRVAVKMQKIYTILANGQVLTPEVMGGILRQRPRCCLVPITSEGDRATRENTRSDKAQESRVKNWNEVKRLCKDEILVGMDRDVILVNRDAIKTLVRELKQNGRDVDMVTFPTKEKQMGGYRATLEGYFVIRPENPDCISTPHSVFAVWRDRFPKIKPVKGECVVCEAIKSLKVKCLYYKKQIEQREW